MAPYAAATWLFKMVLVHRQSVLPQFFHFDIVFGSGGIQIGKSAPFCFPSLCYHTDLEIWIDAMPVTRRSSSEKSQEKLQVDKEQTVNAMEVHSTSTKEQQQQQQQKEPSAAQELIERFLNVLTRLIHCLPILETCLLTLVLLV